MGKSTTGTYSKKAIWSFFLIVTPMVLYLLLGLLFNIYGYCSFRELPFILCAVNYIPLTPFFMFLAKLYEISSVLLWPFSIFSFIFGILAFRDIKKNNLKGKWMTITGIVISILFFIIVVIPSFILISAFD